MRTTLTDHLPTFVSISRFQILNYIQPITEAYSGISSGGRIPNFGSFNPFLDLSQNLEHPGSPPPEYANGQKQTKNLPIINFLVELIPECVCLTGVPFGGSGGGDIVSTYKQKSSAEEYHYIY